MKKIRLFVAFVAITISTFSQQECKSYIEVTGVARYKKTVEKYIVTIVLSKDLLYNDDSEEYASLKESFLNKVKACHIDISKLIENEFKYLTIGYKKKGIVFVFETSSKEELVKFLKIRALGIQLHTKNVLFKEIDIETLSKNAIENARRNAEKIAKNMNKKVGKIIALIDCNTTDISESIYDDSLENLRAYELEVRFEILD